MDIKTATVTCLTKYVDFDGRASRPEFWWFVLFIFVGSLVLSAVSFWLNLLFLLGTLLPQVAAATRRLHDTGRSGWWQLIGLIPVIGWIVMIVFLAQESSSASY